MFKGLYLKNFRGFKKADIQLSRINVLVGPNNSGKSSILSALGLLSQTTASTDQNAALVLRDKIDLGTYEDVVYNNDVHLNVEIGIEFDNEIMPSRYTSGELPAGFIRMVFGYRRHLKQIYLHSYLLEVPRGEKVLETGFSPKTERQIVHFLNGPLSVGDKRKFSRYVRRFNFVPYFFYPFLSRSRDLSKRDIADKAGLSMDLRHHLERLEYLGPFREQPNRTYMFSGESPSSVGIGGERAIDILVADHLKKGKGKKHLLDKTSEWLRKSKISRKMELRPLTERHFEIRLQHSRSGEFENLADVGFGCSQVLPVLVSGLNLSEGRAMIVEQPELHLHPRAQAELGTFFKEIAVKGNQVFIETHSEHLLLRLQSHVARGDLSPRDINVFYVGAKEKGGKSTTFLPLDKDGYFTKDWPEGFFPERLEEAKRIAIINKSKRSKKARR